jgi:hypothetical protein
MAQTGLSWSEDPRLASHFTSESTSNHVWANLAGVRSIGTQVPLLGSPRAPKEVHDGEGQLHIQIPPQWVHNTGTPPRCKTCKALD